MSKYLVDSNDMTNIANAIRQKKGSVNTMTVAQMPNEISTIPTGGGSVDYLEKLLNGTLTSYNIPTSVTAIPEDAFYCISSLASVTIPSTVRRLGFNAFNRTSLSTVVLPNEMDFIGGQAFYGCHNLVSVTLPTVLTATGTDKCNPACFMSCERLTTVNNFNLSTWWPSGQRAYVHDNFFNDTALVGDIYVPESATFGNAAFYNSSSTGILYIHLYNSLADPEELEAAYYFGSSCFDKSHCRLVVPYSSDHSILSAYQTTFPTWSSIMIEENQ